MRLGLARRAASAMLFFISHEIIAEHCHPGRELHTTTGLMLGFVLMVWDVARLMLSQIPDAGPLQWPEHPLCCTQISMAVQREDNILGSLIVQIGGNSLFLANAAVFETA